MTRKLEKQFIAHCNTKSFVQNYECEVCRTNDKLGKRICFDGCLWQEIFYLWNLGIVTVGCCCGNHVNSPLNSSYIQVKTENEQEMLDLGYKKRVNEFGAILFEPKTLFQKEYN